MPAFDEGERLRETVLDLDGRAKEAGHEITLFVIDDGSEPPIDAASLAVGPSLHVVLARHPVNLGQGAAIETARRLALDPRWQAERSLAFEAWVTMDSDGQHRA